MAEPVSFRHQVVSGARISLITQAVLKVLSFFVMLALVRLLTPADFGSISMFLIVYRFIIMLIQSGFELLLVQRKDLNKAHIDGAFWFLFFVGGSLAITGYLTAPALANFYHRPDLTILGQILPWEILIVSCTVVPVSLLKRELKIKQLSIMNLTSTTISLLTTVVLAMKGFQYWALVVQVFIGVSLRFTMAFAFAQWLPRFHFPWNALKPHLNAVRGIVGFNFLNYWARNGDNLLVGKFFGAGDLGFYGRAYGIMMLPLDYGVQGVGEVVYAALCKVQDDIPRMQRIYLKMIGLTAFVVFPVYLGIAAVAYDLVQVMWGETWLPTAALIKVFCWCGCLQALCSPVGWIYLARGQSSALARWGIIGNSILISSIVAGVATGHLLGLVWAYFIGTIIVFFPCQEWALSHINLKTKDLIAKVSKAGFLAVAMYFFVSGLGAFLSDQVTVVLRLVISIIFGILFYAAGAFIFCKEPLHDLLEILGRKKKLSGLVD